MGVVGSQTRSGVFGVCLVSETDEALVFSARPKSRLWRARASDGKVLQTIKLKPGLACNSSPVVSLGRGYSSIRVITGVWAAGRPGSNPLRRQRKGALTQLHTPLAGPEHDSDSMVGQSPAAHSYPCSLHACALQGF